MAKAKYLEVANELRKRIKQGIYNKQDNPSVISD